MKPARVATTAAASLLLLALIYTAGPTAQAQEAAPGPGEPWLPEAASLLPPERAEAAELLRPEPRLHLYAGVDIASQYVSRGLVFSDKVSFQPWFELDTPLLNDERDSALSGASVFFGNWNSLQAGTERLARVRTSRRRTIEHWYEADVYSGARVRLGDRWQSSLRLNAYLSPSDSFRSIYELDWRLRYDDAVLWEQRGWDGFALRPGLRVAKELRDRGGPEQWYIEPRLTPGFPIRFPPWELRAEIPLVFGFGAEGQYRDATGDEHHFGHFRTGLHLTTPLEVLPPDAGSLNLSAGVDVIFLSDDDLSSDSNTTEAVTKLGITYSF